MIRAALALLLFPLFCLVTVLCVVAIVVAGVIGGLLHPEEEW